MIIEGYDARDDEFPTDEELEASFRKHYDRIMMEWMITGFMPDSKVRKSEPEHP